MKDKSASQSVLVCLFTVLAFAVCNSPAWADTRTTTSIDTTGDWNSDRNWDNRGPDSEYDALTSGPGEASARLNRLSALYMEIEADGDDVDLEKRLHDLCRDLLSNPVIEDYELEKSQ
jgi:hypothetical protein